MSHLNLFNHAPKELVTDAFLTWLMYFLDSNEEYQNHKQEFFNKILSSENDLEKISEITVERQAPTHNKGRIDLLVKLKLENEEKQILFENKTYGMASREQLQKYKNAYPNLYKYIYLKLAYLTHHEKKLTKEIGYECLTSEMLAKALKPISHLHPFIEHYLEHINETFVDYIKNFPQKLFEENDYNILYDNQAQHYLMDLLYKKLDGKINNLKFHFGNNNNGRPWTQLYFARKEKTYNNVDEYLFWRIDKRANKFYIRLNQYAYTEHPDKQKRLEALRNIAAEINAKYNLNNGKLYNGGKYEKEVIIFFLRENNLKQLMDALPNFTMEMAERYYNEI